ncbi:MAG: hypothetical protein RIA69_08570 [Cyclobacteriaceae bacterium]
MKDSLKKYLCAVGLLVLVLSAHAQGKDDTLRVLFVGNSYTYFWNLPQTVEAMAISTGIPLTARQSTAGGTNLKQHWLGEEGLKSKSIIEEGDWDIVVLQNHSLSTIDTPDEFTEYGLKFIDLVRSIGAKPILYQTWARAYNPLMQPTITQAYQELGVRAGVEVVPIGELWKKAIALRPDLALYDPDESHPSPIGTYLTATAFYKYLTGNKATTLDKRITDRDRNGQKLYLSIMSEENAVFIQQLVDEFIGLPKKEVNYGK